MAQDKNVRFIRVRGRVVPVKGKSKLRGEQAVYKQAKESERPKTKAKRIAKLAGAFGLTGGLLGEAFRGHKASAVGALSGAIGGAVLGYKSINKTSYRNKKHRLYKKSLKK